MPDDITPTPAPPPEPPQAPPAPKGIDGLMAQLDAAATAPPADPPKPADPAKPAAPADPAKPVPAAPAKPDGEMSVEDMEKFLKAHSNKKPWKVYESLKTTTAQKVAELEGKLSALEKKPVESPGDAAKMAALEKQIEALTGETTTYKQKLQETDYIHTPKYQEINAKMQKVWRKGADLVRTLNVTDELGNSRQGTIEDWESIRSAPRNKQRALAKEAFGDDSDDVLKYVHSLNESIEENEEARSQFVQNYESNSVRQELENKGRQSKFDNAYKSSLDQLKSNEVYGKWFSEDAADPDGSKLLKDGFAEIERVLQQSSQMSPEDAAAHAAVFRARAAAMPRVLLDRNRLAEKISTLESELAKYRATDPGAKGATAGGGVTEENKPRGIDGAALAFDSDPGLIRR